jgi:hypothetical protein
MAAWSETTVTPSWWTAGHQAELDRLVAKVAPFLLGELGVGP